MMIKVRHNFQKIFHKLFNCKAFFTVRRTLFVGLMIVPTTSIGTGMQLYIDNTQYNITAPTILTDTVINLDEKIHVDFAEEIVDPTTYERSVTVMPSEELFFTWAEDHKSVDITPKTIWEPDTTYSLALPYDNYQYVEELSHIFSFRTAQYPHIIAESLPSQNRYIQKDEEIVLTFDRSLENYDIQAVARPFVHVNQYIDEQSNMLHIRILEDSNDPIGEHNMTIFVKYHGQEPVRYFPIGSTRFSTLLPTPEVWPKEFNERLEIARRSTAPLIKAGKYIDVNLDAQITTLFENGDFVGNFVNSPGAKDTPTPKGTFQIYNKDPYALSTMFQVYLPFWMAFTENGEYGFHDLIVWPEGHEDMPSGGKESLSSIGNAVSPGCVRHDAKNSKYIYDWADVGTPVVIH